MNVSLDRVVRWLPRHQLSLRMNYAAATGVMAAAILLEQLLVHFARLPGPSILLMANLVCATRSTRHWARRRRSPSASSPTS